MNSPIIAFEKTRLTLPLDKILPVRVIKESGKRGSRYPAILHSIREVGLIEPLMVYPQKSNPGFYLLMDGHLRHTACRELGRLEVECLVAKEDESFTYNARVSRVAPIQEQQMIKKAVENGVSIERIAKALDLRAADIRAKLTVTDGLASEVIEHLKEKQISPASLRLMRRVLPARQIEIAELMVTANNFTKPYLEALVFATPKDKLIPDAVKKKRKLKPEEIVRMEQEMEAIEREYKVCEQSFSSSMLQLTVFRRYVMKLLENTRVDRFLATRHPEIHAELSAIVASETVC